MTANPDIIADSDGFCPPCLVTANGFKAVAGGVNSHVGTYQAIIPYSNLCIVKHGAVITCIEVITHVDIYAKVTAVQDSDLSPVLR